MSSFAKGVGKAFKSVGKFIKKAWKAVTKSTIGKVVLAAAAIYFAWPAIKGAFAGGGAGAGAGAGATESALLTGGDVLAGAGGVGSTATTASTASGLAAPVTQGSQLVNASQAADMFSAAGSAVSSSQAGAGTMWGKVGDLMAKKTVEEGAKSGLIGSFLKNPVVQQAIVGGVQGAFSPDEIDIMREQKRLQEEYEKERQRRAFSGIEDISLGVRPAAPLPQRDNTGGLAYNSFAPGAGLIGKNMLPYRSRS